jgi:hypothetical protein
MSQSPPVFFHGAGSGAGKSALASRLANSFRWADLNGWCVLETDVLAMSGFEGFMKAFLQSDPGMAQELKNAINWFIAEYIRADTSLTVDAMFPCIHWLLLGEAPRSSIDEFVGWIGERLIPCDPLLISLECTPEVRDQRATTQRGPNWQERHAGRRALYPLYQRLGEAAAKELVEVESLRICQQLPWRQRRISTSDRTVAEVLAEIAGCLGLNLTDYGAWSGPTGDWIGRYRIVEGVGPEFEISAICNELILEVGRFTAPLVLERDGRWLVEGANGWLARDLRQGTLDFSWVGVSQGVYARI